MSAIAASKKSLSPGCSGTNGITMETLPWKRRRMQRRRRRRATKTEVKQERTDGHSLHWKGSWCCVELCSTVDMCFLLPPELERVTSLFIQLVVYSAFITPLRPDFLRPIGTLCVAFALDKGEKVRIWEPIVKTLHIKAHFFTDYVKMRSEANGLLQ